MYAVMESLEWEKCPFMDQHLVPHQIIRAAEVCLSSWLSLQFLQVDLMVAINMSQTAVGKHLVLKNLNAMWMLE